MSIAKQTIKKIVATQEALGAKTGFIGATVYYDVSSETEVDHDRLERIFLDVGLPAVHLPGLPSPHKVFRYCVDRGANGVADAKVIQISREATHDVWGIYPVNVVGDGEVMDREAQLGEPMAKLGFFPDDPQNPGQPLLIASENGSLTMSPTDPVAANIIAEWNRRKGVHTNPDISEMIRATLKRMGRIRLKRGGHLYFVPAPQLDDLRKLRDVVDAIGFAETSMAIIPAARHPDGIAEIVTEARKGFEEEIKVLRDKVEAFTDGTRESTKERTVGDAMILKAQLELYRDISAELVESLQADAEALVGEVRTMMGA